MNLISWSLKIVSVINYTQKGYVGINTWRRHQMEPFSALLAYCAGNLPFPGHKGQWRGALMFSLICALINGWVNTREAGDLKRHHAHYDVIVMYVIGFTEPAAHIQCEPDVSIGGNMILITWTMYCDDCAGDRLLATMWNMRTVSKMYMLIWSHYSHAEKSLHFYGDFTR